uniref:GST C-terminal domain-containing protein n=1 Tax=Meloidogyne hapla TaxID=6305 RepID=A0A1I8BMR3_MELHA
RINNQFKLGSPKNAQVPFIQFNGEFIEGVENIINKLNYLGKYLKENEGEKEIINIVHNILFTILMKDRTKRDINGNGGFDFLIKDLAIHRQLLPKMEEFYDQYINLIINEEKVYIFKFNEEFWNELFYLEKGIELNEFDEENIYKFLNKYIKVEGYSKTLGLEDWGIFIEKKNEWIEFVLKKYFTEGEQSFEYMLIQQISFNKEIKTINDIINYFDKYLSKLSEMFVGNDFLFGNEPSNADIYLFAVLIQFFEGPILNISELYYFFRLKNNQKGNYSNQNYSDKKGKGIIENGYSEIEENEKDEIIEIKEDKIIENKEILKIEYLDKRINILYNFVQKMKKKLGFKKESDWENLTKFPWELNYENDDLSNKKYIETNNLIGIDKFIGYNKWSELWSLIIGKNEYLKNKNGTLWQKIKATIKGKSKPSKEDFDELTLKILAKIHEYININFASKIEFINFGKISFNFLASYLCNIGREYSIEDGNECYKKYIRKVERKKQLFLSEFKNIYMLPFDFKEAKKVKNDIWKTVETLSNEVIKIVIATIKEINEQKINENVRKGIIIAEEKEID